MLTLIAYFGIGFLIAVLLGLLIVPLVHKRAVRLAMRHHRGASLFSVPESGTKEQLRAEFTLLTRGIEINAEQLKTKMTEQLADLGRTTDAVNHLKKALNQEMATVGALEARDKSLQDQLRAAKDRTKSKSTSLSKCEHALAENEAKVAKARAELGDRSIAVEVRVSNSLRCAPR